MFSQSNSTSASLCVGCLSSDKFLNHITDIKREQIFYAILDAEQPKDSLLLLCYECKGRLESVLKFKNQVKCAQNCLVNVSNNIYPKSLSKLNYANTDIFHYKPSYTKETQQNDSSNHCDVLQIVNNESIQNGTIFNESVQNGTFVNESVQNGTFLNESVQNGTFINESVQNGTFIRDDVQNGTLTQKTVFNSEIAYISKSFSQNLPRNEGTLIRGPHLDIKVEAVGEKLELKKEIEENDIEEVNLEERIDSFDESDDEPLRNIKMVKDKEKRDKKGKRGYSRAHAAGVVSSPAVANRLRALNLPPGVIEVVILSWDQVREEREKASSSPRYLSQEFRCELCVVGFNHRFKLDAHMAKHSQEKGDIVCEICKTRFKTNSALLSHKQRHRTRWRCTVCLALYSRASVAADHSARAHQLATPTHTCHVCSTKLSSLSKLRVHLRTHAEKQHCEECGKTFADKSSLRTHLFIHSDQKDFVCPECEKRFRFKKALEIHLESHRPSELLYCAECDVNFKNQRSFYQHMKYSMKHIHPDKISHACEFCARRFSKPARLQEHRRAIHLGLAPHKCSEENCSYASPSRSALRTHIRLIHRNKKTERKYVCDTCGKTFTTLAILTGHVLTHSGTRPLSCVTCGASFTHQAALYNHRRLVHKVPFVKRRKNPPWNKEGDDKQPVTNN